jgi:transcriptional regulator with XRE-family HTH domain
MKRLKALRLASNYTQEDLASKLDVTQQTIGRWETGKAEPNIAALRDIAVIFGTSVDDLLDMESRRVTTNHYCFSLGQGERNSSEVDGFWGHVGVLLNGDQKTRWYPITLGEANRCSTALQSSSTGSSPWLAVGTLNNRLLVFHLSAVKRIWLLDDGCDQPDNDDWDLPWDGYQGYSLEIYRGLEDHFFSHENYEEAYSSNLRNLIDDVVEKCEIDEDKLADWVLNTHIYFTDRTKTSYCVDERALHELVLDIEGGEPNVFSLPEFGGGFESYYPSSSIRLIDMPLLKYRSGCEAVLRDLES